MKKKKSFEEMFMETFYGGMKTHISNIRFVRNKMRISAKCGSVNAKYFTAHDSVTCFKCKRLLENE